MAVPKSPDRLQLWRVDPPLRLMSRQVEPDRLLYSLCREGLAGPKHVMFHSLIKVVREVLDETSDMFGEHWLRRGRMCKSKEGRTEKGRVRAFRSSHFFSMT